jgi:LPXTG-motif cell wall-anchored protein
MLVAGEGKATGLPKVRHKVTRSYLEEAATVRGDKHARRVAVRARGLGQDPCPSGALVDGRCLSAADTAVRHAANERGAAGAALYPSPPVTSKPTAPSTPTATAICTATSQATAPPTSTPTATVSGTANDNAAASAPAPADEQEDRQDGSKRREASQDESTSSEDAQPLEEHSGEQTTLPETGEESSNPNFAALAGITLIGLALSGLLATRAIWPGRG